MGLHIYYTPNLLRQTAMKTNPIRSTTSIKKKGLTLTVNARIPLSLFIKTQSVRRKDVRGKKTSLTHKRKPNTKNMGRIECSNGKKM